MPVLIPHRASFSPFRYSFENMHRYVDVFRSRLRIAVVYGGDKHRENAVVYKTWNPRPWKSYEGVARDIQAALQALGFVHVKLMPDDMLLPQRLKDEGIHLVWLNTGGVQGYDSLSHSAAALELMGIPYVGHTPHNASLLDNKGAFKRALQALNIPTAPFLVWHPAQGTLTLRRLRETFNEYAGPFVIKPVSGRASLHISVIDSAHQILPAAQALASTTRAAVLIEAYLPGREFCVAVCGKTLYRRDTLIKLGQPFAFSAVERLLEPDEVVFTSMDVRDITHNRIRSLTDDEPEKAHLLRLARTIYTEFNLTSLIRIDVRADANNVLNILEANPKPDLAHGSAGSTSLVAAHLTASQMTYHDLIMSLLVDRLDYLFRYNPETVTHLVELLA